MKKIVSSLAALILTMCLLLPFTASAALASASLAGPGTVRAGDTITLTFKLSGSGLFGASGTLSYDGNQLQLTGTKQVIAAPWAVEFNGSNMVAYDNNLSSPINGSKDLFTMSFKVKDVAAGTKITVSYTDVKASVSSTDANVGTVSYSVTVEARRPLGIALTPPDKTVYQQGEPLDLAGLQLLALYEDGRWTPVPAEAENLEITGYDPERTGRQTIHVTWQGYVQYFVVEVTPRPLEGAVYTVENAVGKPGEQITIPVTMTDNPGLAGLSHTIQFDPEVLRFESVEMAGSLAGREPAVNAEKADAGQVSLVWFSPTDALGDGPAYILTFTILETAPLGSSDVRLSFGGRDNMNAGLVPILFSVINGRVQVVDYILGDVDGNGSLGMMDALLLAQVLSGQSIELDEAQRLAADTDQNGVVELADVILLSQWLAEQTA